VRSVFKKSIGMKYLKTCTLKPKWNYLLQFFETLHDYVENNFFPKKKEKAKASVIKFSKTHFQWLLEKGFWGKYRMKSTCSLYVQIHRKLGNAFVRPFPSPTQALLLNSCRIRTRSPWPNLWHAASTKGQFVLHDLPFV